MLWITRGQTVDGSAPLLEFLAVRDGLLQDLYSLTFEIVNLSGPAPVVEVSETSVNVAVTYPTGGAGRLARGRYFATWTVPSTGATPARYEVRWRWRFASGDVVQLGRQPFEVVKTAGLRPRVYCSVADLRDEGVRLTDVERLQLAIVQASAFIERATGRAFVPVYRTFTFDGSGHDSLRMRWPIVGIGDIRVDGQRAFTADTEVAQSDYRPFARHLQGLTDPDDRRAPRIIRLAGSPPYGSVTTGTWPRGTQNVQIAGAFGYTDDDGDGSNLPWGRTPVLIEQVCRRLALAQIAKLATGGGGTSSASSSAGGPVKRIRTRDQEIEYSVAAAAASATATVTGDPQVDSVLEAFRAPPTFLAV